VDPLTSVAAASKTSSFWVTKELTSVLAPGVVLLGEILLLTHPLVRKRMSSPLGPGEPNIFAVLVILLALSWLVGYISRELAFKVLGFTEPLPPEPKAEADATPEPASADGKPASEPAGEDTSGLRRWLKAFRCPHFNALELERRMRDFCGEAEVDAFRQTHPIADHLLTATAERARKTPEERAQEDEKSRKVGGGNMPNDSGTQFFTYCKLWLHRNAPEFGLESIELEINILVATLVPVALLPVVTAVTVRSHVVPWTIAAAATALCIVGQATRSFRRLRGSERWEAARNAVIATTLRRIDAVPMMANSRNQPNTQGSPN
jgi:hypothetical protein